MSDINLTLTNAAEKKKGNLVFMVSLGIFGVIFVVSAIIMLISFLTTSRARSLPDTEAATRNKITALSVQKVKLVSINERLSTINKIVSSRKQIDARANTILSIIPDGFNIDSFTADDKQLTVSLSSLRLTDFDTFLEEKIPIFAKDKSSGVSRISINSFSQGKTDYSISLSFNY